MTPPSLNIARRAVACKGWRWMPGMRYRLSPRHPWCRYEGGDASDYDGTPVTAASPSDRSAFALPDLSDPATLGCVLALVREAWKNEHLWVEVGVDPAMWSLTVYSIGWACVNGETPLPDIDGESEAEALVAALEAAPAAGGAR